MSIERSDHTGSNPDQNNAQMTRDLDPNIRQKQSSEPSSSVWVSASAGTGKTKVLTDRVLRLLLPRQGCETGTPPYKILCLTFTKAAASEMALRISKTLSSWAVMNESQLAEKLGDLLNREINAHDLKSARQLFAKTVDSSPGLQIMTIHSFCQSILGRFPLEAKINPNFKVLEESDASELLYQARIKALAEIHAEHPDLKECLNNITNTISEDQFAALIKDITKERFQYERIIRKHWDKDGLYQAICTFLNIETTQNIDTLEHQITDIHPNLQNLFIQAIDFLQLSEKSADIKTALNIQNYLKSPSIATYREIFLKKYGNPRKNYITKSHLQSNPDLGQRILDHFERECQRLLDLLETIKKYQCAALTRDLFAIAYKILEEYSHSKEIIGALDFDDLILKTLGLLKGHDGSLAQNDLPMHRWVNYKLDQGLDHILIDEAQDTNPEQWEIIEALSNEFFDGLNAHDETERTVFTVGDEKQSIYSFQRASPEEFTKMRQHFGNRIQQAKQDWRNIDLNISFRSTQAILDAVDAVFSQSQFSGDSGFEEIKHHSYRKGQAGHVELWPIFENEKEDQKYEAWDPPLEIVESKTGAMLCAEFIADQIKNWLDSNRILQSHGRPVEPGDIMILLRSRSTFMNSLIRSLKNRNIPVSGHDRLVVQNEICIEDLIALSDFCLFPDDDLALACVLKSPLINLTEDDLYSLCVDRPATLWESLKFSSFRNIVDYLRDCRKAALSLTPYDFFADLLNTPCPADHISGWRAFSKRLGTECFETFYEFLNACLNFEKDNPSSLQHLIHAQKSQSLEIKRELEEGHGQIRIMTVHGSKGLQAPIVILPDTTRTARSVHAQTDKRLLWPQKTGLDIPLWSPRKDHDCTEFADALAMIEDRYDQEYGRLLYVAMTRAEEELYISGYKSKKEPIQECWYNYVRNGLMHSEQTEEIDNGLYKLSTPQIKDPDKANPKGKKLEYRETKLPDWLYQPAPQEPFPPKPLTPSKPSIMEPASLSPLVQNDQKRFLRGNLTHKLLEFLPDIEPDERPKKAHKFLKLHGNDISEDVKEDIIKEIFMILDHPEFSSFFAKGSRAEVPITGLLNGTKLVSAQIDRLLIGKNDIWVLDYKTNRPSPINSNDIPQIYQDQMQLYHDILKEIYPQHNIHCALLWTDTPRLMPVTFNRA